MGEADPHHTAARIGELRQALTDVAEPGRAVGMAAYMKDQFPFLGVMAGPRREAQRSIINALSTGRYDSEARPRLLAFADACWREPEREFHYAATDALRKHARHFRSDDLPAIRRLIQTESWWDTIDALAVHVVGPMVTADPTLGDEMDRWIDDEDLWVARTAILHQLMYKDRTDDERLFEYCDRRADDTEFFIRKALGWALRQYARTNPEAVRLYVELNADRLSGLTKREALKHLR